MELICGIDFESTGFSAEKDYITEIGAALFDAKTWEVKDTFSTFVKIPIPVPPEIIKITGITDEMCASGLPIDEAISKFELFQKNSKAFIAHNAPFDKSFYEAASPIVVNKPWYCSKEDLPHEGKRCKILSHLALDHGVNVDISKLHRALDDVLLMGQMLKVIGWTFSQLEDYSNEPWIYLAMADRKFDEKNNKEAREQGYGWEKCVGTYNPVFPKRWVKKCKASKLEEEKAKPCGFKREVISQTTS